MEMLKNMSGCGFFALFLSAARGSLSDDNWTRHQSMILITNQNKTEQTHKPKRKGKTKQITLKILKAKKKHEKYKHTCTHNA